jgi:drug/metabolite transporter (DMT)-like permease
MSVKNIIELVILAALWGASFLFMRIAVPEFGAIALIEARVLIAGLVLLPFWWLRESSSSRQKVMQHWPRIFVIGLLNSAIPFVLFAYSMLYITGGMAAILNGTAPIWGAVVAWFWLRSRMSMNGVLGLIVGFIGVVLLVSDELAVPAQGKALAILASASAPLLYGIAANYTSVKLADVSALSIATFSQLSAAICLLPILYWFMPAQMPSFEAWMALLALAVLCTSLAYLMFFRLIAEVGSTRAITVTFLIPLFGSLWGAIFIDEEITVMMMVGMAIVLFGTALVTGVVKIVRLTKESSL